MQRRAFPELAGVVLLWGLAVNVSTAKYSGGTGEPNDPYRVATAEDLNDIGNHIEDFNKCFVCVNDINLADYTGTQFNIIGNLDIWFSGVFDGNGKKISNFTYSCAGVDYIGLFRLVDGRYAVIKDLDLVDPNVAGTQAGVGSLVGDFASGAITGCYVTGGRVSGHHDVGGLVGMCGEGLVTSTISNCHAEAVVSGLTRVGGLAGLHWEGTMSNCSSSGSVEGYEAAGGLAGSSFWPGAVTFDCTTTSTVSGDHWVGGLVGISDAVISNCRAGGNVTGMQAVAGLVGRSGAELYRSCCSGNVQGTTDVGGLVGTFELGQIIRNCYSVGSVTGSANVGGLVGTVYYDPYGGYGRIHNCYAAGRVCGQDDVGGLVGVGDSSGLTVVDSFWDVDNTGVDISVGGTGKTTAEMKTESTFTDAGWDFVEVWDIGEGQTYPFLRTASVGDLNHSGLVNWRDFAILAGHWLEEEE
jgi:hypothetical protein